MQHDFSLLWLAIACYFGLLFGSFSSALIYRIPRGIPWVFNTGKNEGDAQLCRSACPNCHTQLRAIDLVPLFSWLALRGKCRYCKSRISAVYPMAELCCLLGFASVYLVFGLSWSAILIYLMIPFLVALLFIDLEHFILPDELVALIAAAGTLYLVVSGIEGQLSWSHILFEHLLGGAILYGAFAYILGRGVSFLLKKDALGFGDVKFFAAAGLWLGLTKFSDFLIVSGFVGVIFALLWRLIKKEDVFPFGPALIVTFLVLLLFESSLFS